MYLTPRFPKCQLFVLRVLFGLFRPKCQFVSRVPIGLFRDWGFSSLWLYIGDNSGKTKCHCFNRGSSRSGETCHAYNPVNFVNLWSNRHWRRILFYSKMSTLPWFKSLIYQMFSSCKIKCFQIFYLKHKRINLEKCSIKAEKLRSATMYR